MVKSEILAILTHFVLQKHIFPIENSESLGSPINNKNYIVDTR